MAFRGPFTHHDVIVDGWRVPLLQTHLPAEDRVMLVLDHASPPSSPSRRPNASCPFVADAIAVALGYGHTQTTICPAPLRVLPIRAQGAW